MIGYEALVGAAVQTYENGAFEESCLSEVIPIVNPTGLLSSPGLCRERSVTICAVTWALGRVQWTAVCHVRALLYIQIFGRLGVEHQLLLQGKAVRVHPMET